MRQWTIDAFASEPFKGNQACILEPFETWPDAAWMQSLAAENNQAETAYLLKTADPARFGLRWFTPALEVPLCGHATLASGHVLFAELGAQAARLTFDTQSGALTVAKTASGYEMNFPSDPPAQTVAPAELASALGAEPVEVWVAQYAIAVLANEEAVRELAPDITALKDISAGARSRGNVAVTALADPGKPYDVVSRFFAPGSGIAEDPATGSLHCILAPLFASRLGRSKIRFHQAYPGRGAEMECEVSGDRVLIRGQAVTVMETMLRL